MQQVHSVTLAQLWQYIIDGEDWRVTAVIAITILAIATVWIVAIRADRLARAKVIDLDAPVQCGDITAEHLARFNGTDPFLPLYLAIQGRVYDVSKGRAFYGPGACRQRPCQVDAHLGRRCICGVCWARVCSCPGVHVNQRSRLH